VRCAYNYPNKILCKTPVMTLKANIYFKQNLKFDLNFTFLTALVSCFERRKKKKKKEEEEGRK
jgi:hypothetical protein